MIETPISLLDSGKMGCYPDKIAAWKIAVIALVGIVLVVTVIVATIIIKRSKEARWLIYKNFNKLIQVEEQEDIDGYEFDAFVSYRSVFTKFLDSKANFNFICQFKTYLMQYPNISSMGYIDFIFLW